PYIGRNPFLGASAGNHLFFSVSTPVVSVESKKKLGLLVLGIRCDSLSEWFTPFEQRKGDESDKTRADVVLLDGKGYCLHHRKNLKAKYVPEPGKHPSLTPEFKEIAIMMQNSDDEPLLNPN